ncbi:RINGv [Musa troglodytarum]|uniref:RINGv n=1 Tax=Musa troglodytarum TaxID=320322 RepID=A0A9E7JZJ8_9LILI|nr:RINGv [Musa troglodytarum]
MISDDGAGGMEQKMPESDFQPNYDTGHHHVSENDSSHPCGRVKIEGFEVSLERHVDRAFDPSAISIEVSQSVDILERKVGSPRIVISEADLEFISSGFSVSRVCQQQTEEVLVDLGCRCSGDLAKAHRSCIELWFHTKGSNKCEICQQIATNVPFSESQPITNNWFGRTNSAYAMGQRRAWGCFSPLLVAFVILLGGLLLDVLISVSLGVTALPFNITIGAHAAVVAVQPPIGVPQFCHVRLHRRALVVAGQRDDPESGVGVAGLLTLGVGAGHGPSQGSQPIGERRDHVSGLLLHAALPLLLAATCDHGDQLGWLCEEGGGVKDANMRWFVGME